MAAKKDVEPIDPLRQLSCVLAIFALRRVEPEEAAVRLDFLGFSAKEIAGILGKNANYVHYVKNKRNADK